MSDMTMVEDIKRTIPFAPNFSKKKLVTDLDDSSASESRSGKDNIALNLEHEYGKREK